MLTSILSILLEIIVVGLIICGGLGMISLGIIYWRDDLD